MRMYERKSIKVLQWTIHMAKVIYSSHEYSQALIGRVAHGVKWYGVV